MVIISKENKEYRELKSLLNKKERDKKGLFLVEGDHQIKEALKNNCLLKVISKEEENYSLPNIIISPKLLKSLSSLETPTVMGLCKKKNNKIIGDTIIALNHIQDPSNMGAIMRSAKAFGIKTIISDSSVDFYNSKVIRASEGYLFSLNLINCNLKEELLNLKREGYKIIMTSPHKGNDPEYFKNIKKKVIVMGNEGQGISEDLFLLNDEIICIKTKDVESLNVNVSLAIILYELSKNN